MTSLSRNRYYIKGLSLKRLVRSMLIGLVLAGAFGGELSAVETFRPEFRDIEIRDFLKTMSRITQKNILIDDAVKGKITIISHKDIPVYKAYDFMKDVLEVRGYAIVETGSFIKIVPSQVAAGLLSPDKKARRARAGMVTRVIKFPASINANEINNLLRGIVDKDTKIAVYRPGNSLIVTGYAAAVNRVVGIIDELAPGTGKEGKVSEGDLGNDSIHIYRLKNLPADSVAQVLVRLDMPEIETGSDPQSAPKRGAANKIKAVAHKESNSLIITASAAEWEEIRKIIERLDEQRKQILLEVLIAEVSSNRLNDFGIDWRYQGPNAAHTQFNTGYAVEGNLVSPETGQITGANTLSGFSLGFLRRGGDLMGIFNANISNQNFNVLSAPQILTLDNQEAEINVGQDVPVRTQERTSGGGSAEATVNSYEYRPSGIKLKFTPHVSAAGLISLDLFTEITNIEGGASAISNPTFNKRNVKTYVTVDNKQTIVIGGLVSTERLQAIKKIPLLGDIPILGYMFRRTTYTTKKVNLMVFLTPNVLNDRNDADRISTFKRDAQIRESRKTYNDTRLWPETAAPSPEREPPN